MQSAQRFLKRSFFNMSQAEHIIDLGSHLSELNRKHKLCKGPSNEH